MKLEYDKEANAIYIYIKKAPYSYGENLDIERRIDYDADGNPIGIELLCVSTGVNTDNLPYKTEVEKLLGDRGIKIYAQN